MADKSSDVANLSLNAIKSFIASAVKDVGINNSNSISYSSSKAVATSDSFCFTFSLAFSCSLVIFLSCSHDDKTSLIGSALTTSL